jgi:hypothetical protein
MKKPEVKKSRDTAGFRLSCRRWVRPDITRRLSITGWANYTKKAEKEIDKKKVEKLNVCCKILMFSTIIRHGREFCQATLQLNARKSIWKVDHKYVISN